MAKDAEKKPADPVAEAEPQKPADPVAEAEPQKPAEPAMPRWKVAARSGEVPESIVAAATVEDAVRAFNGQSHQFSFKQLIINPA